MVTEKFFILSAGLFLLLVVDAQSAEIKVSEFEVWLQANKNVLATYFKDALDERETKYNRTIQLMNEAQTTNQAKLESILEYLNQKLDQLAIKSSWKYRKQAQGELNTLFRTANWRKEVQRMGNLILDVGVEWMDRKELGVNGPRALDRLCEFYEGEDLLTILEILVDNGVKANYKDVYERTPLMNLCMSNPNPKAADVVHFLIGQGIDVHHTDIDQRNALMLLCAPTGENLNPNRLEIMKVLISKGIEVNYKTKRGINSLMLLAKYHEGQDSLVELVRLLVSSGIDVNAKDNMGHNVLNYLCANKNIENEKSDLVSSVIKILISNGLRVDGVTRKENESLQHVCAIFP